jgi:SAM-dependent methyltransferase
MKRAYCIGANIFFFTLIPQILFADNLSCKENNYFIKQGYIARTSYHHHDDREFEDGSQNEVYEAAYDVTIKNNLTSIADIGCGSGYKLIKYFNAYNTIGYEIEPTLGFLRNKYPDKSWKESMLSSWPDAINVDLIICSDVVEHLVDPDDLLNFINRFNFKYLVISTPDRDKLPSIQQTQQSQTGPPVNSAHIREWSFDEFHQYIAEFFEIVDHFNTEKEWWGQVIIAVKKLK